MLPKNIYLNNRELLNEIHNCKVTFCSYLDKAYVNYDTIVMNLDQITDELIQTLKEKRATQQMIAERDQIKAATGKKTADIKVTPVTADDIPTESLIFRHMTHEHIPLDPDRKRKAKDTDQSYTRTNFPPFKHYIMQDGELKEVLRSHWVGGFENGHFELQGGKITNKMATMFLLLVERYGRRPNFRGYSYLDEMKGLALLQLTQNALLFNEAKSANPFAFFTTIINNCFIRSINVEKRNHNIRDDILIMNGAAPSFNRQIDNEIEQRSSEN